MDRRYSTDLVSVRVVLEPLMFEQLLGIGTLRRVLVEAPLQESLQALGELLGQRRALVLDDAEHH